MFHPWKGKAEVNVICDSVVGKMKTFGDNCTPLSENGRKVLYVNQLILRVRLTRIVLNSSIS